MTGLEHNVYPKRRGTVAARLLALSVCVVSALGLAFVATPQTPALRDAQKQRDFGLPELHKINLATLEPSYGCRPPDEFEKGYAKTALFLSKLSRDTNSPELLFDGACRGQIFSKARGTVATR